MTHRTRAALAIVVTLVFGIRTAADSRKAAALLREAEVNDVVLGDVKAAIALYERAVAEAGDDRATAARALLALGVAKQKIADPGAREDYELVVRGFGDQKEFASAARARLAALGVAGRKQLVAGPRRLLALDRSMPAGDVTADGRFWITVRDDSLVQYDLATAEARELVSSRPGRVLAGAKISPDGRRIAFIAWDDAPQPSERHPVLMLVDASGGTPQVLAQAPAGVSSMTVAGWKPDGSAVLARCRTGSIATSGSDTLVWLSAKDGSSRLAHTFVDEPATRASVASLSPDGRFVAYITRVAPHQVRITVLNLQQGTESAVVRFAAENTSPLWTADGSHLLFTSDRSGTQAVWAVAVHEGLSTEEPVRVFDTPGPSYSPQSIRISAGGVLHYLRFNDGGSTISLFQHGAGTPQLMGAFAGTSASFSADGTSLAYVQEHQRGNDLIVRSINSGEERRYDVAGLDLTSPRWFPDGERILVVAKDTGTGKAFFALRRSTGESTRLFPVDTAEHTRSTVGALSPDGRTLYVSTRAATGPWTQIVAIDIGTGAEKGTLDIPGGLSPQAQPGLAISPDGSTIAVQGRPREATGSPLGRLLVIRLSGDSHDVINGFSLASVPDKIRWSRDGQSLFFVQGTSSADWKLMRVGISGAQPQVEYDPVSPDSQSRRGMAPFSFDISVDESHFTVGTLALPTAELWSVDLSGALSGR